MLRSVSLCGTQVFLPSFQATDPIACLRRHIFLPYNRRQQLQSPLGKPFIVPQLQDSRDLTVAAHHTHLTSVPIKDGHQTCCDRLSAEQSLLCTCYPPAQSPGWGGASLPHLGTLPAALLATVLGDCIVTQDNSPTVQDNHRSPHTDTRLGLLICVASQKRED
jgi:hypothetical protein